MADDEDFPSLAMAPNELLDQVGLPVQGVVVVARLLREPEAEEIGGEYGVLPILLQQ